MAMTHRHRKDRVRLAVAREAARVMYREGVSQYLDAKRIAAKRVLGREARGALFRPGDLPSNGEIREALLVLVELSEGKDRTRRLFAMRAVALTLLKDLERWNARLIGSVWSGHARRGSDIDVHVFGDLEDIEQDLSDRGWTSLTESVLIRVPGGFETYHHVHVLDQRFPVELSVYPAIERTRTQRSSVDGKAIDRVSMRRLEARLREEHGDDWATYLADGVLDLDGLDDDVMPGEFSGLLSEMTT